jgi:hypothetical protein
LPAKDMYHECVRAALIADGWMITHDPLRIEWGLKDMFIDLGAEQLLAAERAGSKIAVEIKSFASASDVDDLERAIGQFVVYHDVLEEIEPDRVLYLAVPITVAQDVFEEPLGQLLMRKRGVRLFGFDPDTQEIVKWIPANHSEQP